MRQPLTNANQAPLLTVLWTDSATVPVPTADWMVAVPALEMAQ